MGGGTFHGGFKGTQGATRAEYEAALEAEKKYKHKERVPPKGGKSKDDVAGWVSDWRPRIGESGKDFATRIMDLKYGKGNYDTAPGFEHSKIKKYADTHFTDKRRKRK